MGHCGSICSDSRERGCWSAILYPKNAPEWFGKLVGGLSSDNVHLQPPPPDSALLLGYISLAVPELEPAEVFWVKGGMHAGRSIREEVGKELRVNVGPSQLRFPLVPGREAERWPGEVTVWVEDIRTTTDSFYMIGRALGTDLVNEYRRSAAGGEFMLKLKDAFRGNFFFFVTEAPQGWAAKIRALPQEPSMGDGKTFNPVAISDATVFVTSRDAMLGVVRFYNHFLQIPMAACGPTQYVVQLHFAPGDGLHQTLTFRQEVSTSYARLGSLCIYIKDHHKFVLALAKCKMGGILVDPSTSREDVERECEFCVRAIVDPETHAELIPLVHVIRHASHPECPLR